MRFDLTFYLFAWVLLMLLALLFCRFWPGGKRAPAVPKPAKRKRDPKPFVGYTRKPDCELCQQPQSSGRLAPGAAETIASILSKRGWKINTSFAERLNLDFRQHVAAIGRWVNTLCKHENGLQQQLTIFQAYHNFVLPHASLRVPLPEVETIPKTGAFKRWQPRTPAIAAGLTDRFWSVRELLMYRVPPWPQWSVKQRLGNIETGNLSARRASVNQRGTPCEDVITQLATD